MGAWMTCRRDGLTHAVSNADLGSTIRMHMRIYRSLCGTMIVPRPAAEPMGPFCPYCRALSRP